MDIVMNLLNNLSKDIVLTHTIYKEEPITSVYLENGEIKFIPCYIYLIYKNKFLIDTLVRTYDPCVFTLESAHKFSVYISKNILDQEIVEAIEEINGFTKNPSSKECLESLKLKKKDNIEDSCTICLENLSDEIIELKCKHVFCKECIYKHLQEYSKTCPICRTEIDESKKVINNVENSHYINNMAYYIDSEFTRCESEDCKYHNKIFKTLEYFCILGGAIELDECFSNI